MSPGYVPFSSLIKYALAKLSYIPRKSPALHTLYHHPMIIAVFLHLQHTPQPPLLPYIHHIAILWSWLWLITQLIVAWIFPPQPPHHLAYCHPDIYSPYHHSAPCHTYVMSPFYDCGHTYTQLHHLDIHLLDLSSIVTLGILLLAYSRWDTYVRTQAFSTLGLV